MDDARFELNSKIRAYFQSLRNFSFHFYNSTAILFEKNGDVRFKKIPLPSPSKNECTILAENTFISPGTEFAQLNKLPNAKISYPFNPGYSGSGIVIRAGRATGYKKNQRVCGLIPHASISNVDHRNLFKIPNNSDPKTSSFITFAIIILRSLDIKNYFYQTQLAKLINNERSIIKMAEKSSIQNKYKNIPNILIKFKNLIINTFDDRARSVDLICLLIFLDLFVVQIYILKYIFFIIFIKYFLIFIGSFYLVYIKNFISKFK